MGKFEKLEQLQKLKDNGSLTEEEFKKEKEKLLNGKKESKNTKLIIFIFIIVIAVIGVIVFCFINKNKEVSSNDTQEVADDGFKQSSANAYAKDVSFNNMKSDSEDFSEEQQEIIKYFDNNYFQYYGLSAQKYPQIFKGAKVMTDCVVVKVINSTDEEFEVVAAQGWAESYNDNLELEEIENESSETLFILKGKQLNERLTKGDELSIYGRYNDVVTTEIDGKSYTIPEINAINISNLLGVDNVTKYNLKTVKTVAEYIFGKDIKVNEPVEEEDYDPIYEGGDFYKVTLDNQSNANFKVFNMYKNYGLITYNSIHNGLSSNIQKRLFVSADFQHYIVSTYDEDLKHVYIDYFDKDLKKLWSREFDYNSTKAFSSPMDYTDKQMAVVVDNDLYLIDLETGENVIEPVIVGEKIAVNMMDDGIVLIGDNNKDTVMKVEYDGKVTFRINAGTDMNSIESARTQIVNGKMVVYLTGTTIDDGIEGPGAKYLVINNDGTIECSTKDLS